MRRGKWRKRCPSCGSVSYKTRTEKRPRHRCVSCGDEFEHPADAKRDDTTPSGDLIPEDLADAPASRKLVFAVLVSTGRLSTEGLVERTGLAQSTVKRSLRELRDRGYVVERTAAEDGRRSEFGAVLTPNANR